MDLKSDIKKLSSPSTKVKKFLISENKENDKLGQKTWFSEFSNYMKTFLNVMVYRNNSSLVDDIVSNEQFLMMLKRGFTDGSESADDYEALEFVGDELYNQAFKLFIYRMYKGNITPLKADAMKQHYVSNQFMETMSVHLKMDQWIILGGPSIALNQKMKANLIEAFCGSIYMINSALKNVYIKNEDWKNAALLPLNPVQLFINNYFGSFPPKESESILKYAKSFLQNTLPDTFGLRGAIRFVQQGKKSIFKIDKELIEKIAENLSESVYKQGLMEVTNENSIEKIKKVLIMTDGMSDDSENENNIAREIMKIYNEEIGLSLEWTEAFKDFAKINSLPEPYNSQMKQYLVDLKQKDPSFNYIFRFEEPLIYIDKVKKTKTVILYLVKGDPKNGKTKEKVKLEHYTGPIFSHSFENIENVKLEVVKKFLSRI